MPVYTVGTNEHNRRSPVVTISRYAPDAHYASLSIQQSQIDVIAILLFSKTRLGSVQFWSAGSYIRTDYIIIHTHTHTKVFEYLLLKCETIKIYVLDLKDNSCKIQDMKIISVKISSESDNIYKNHEIFTANIYI